MKYTLYIFFAALLFASCKKSQKPDQQNCYTCTRTDSVTSNIPKLAKPHYSSEVGHICSYTEAQKNFYVKTNSKVDTLYFSNDTLELNHFVMTCIIE